MTVVAGRRTAVVVTALVAAGMVGLVPVEADTGNLAYSCALPVLGNKAFKIAADTNASVVYLGKSFSPTLKTTAYVPADLSNLAADSLNATSVDGTIVSHLRIGGVQTNITQPITPRSLPASTEVPIPVVANGALPKLTPTAVGSLTYLPGDLHVTLNFRKAGGGSVGEFKNIPCTMAATTKIIDKVVFAKSPTRITPTVTYAKAAKKVTAVAKVTATSGIVPTGKVTAVLYRGTAKLRTLSATLVGGRATTVFTGISRAGTYKVVLTYVGGAKWNKSATTKSFSLR